MSAPTQALEPLFDEDYIDSAFAQFSSISPSRPLTSSTEINNSNFKGDLQSHAHTITRARLYDECENALAELSPSAAENLLGIFEQVCDSFLPAPLWQVDQSESKGKRSFGGSGKAGNDGGLILKCLKVVAAARLALASTHTMSGSGSGSGSGQEPPLKLKVDNIGRAVQIYLDSVPESDKLEDLEALLLLAELEYGRDQTESSRGRLQSVIRILSDQQQISSSFLFGQNERLLRYRSTLRTALMMLHWYSGEAPSILMEVDGDGCEEIETPEPGTSTDEAFVLAQLRLASLHCRLKGFLAGQALLDERTWAVCERAMADWYEELRASFRRRDMVMDDAPINFFVFHQQYLSTRIMLSKFNDRASRKRRDKQALGDKREMWSCPNTTKSDAVKIASSLRNYGQKHRFREAPLCFVNHISNAADVIIAAVGAAPSDEDRNVYLHILTFLGGVLKFMSEVHVRAGRLQEALQLRMNAVVVHPHSRSNSIKQAYEASSVYSANDGHDSQLWHWARYDLGEDPRRPLPAPQSDRPRSVTGVLQTAATLVKRPKILRQHSTPSKLEVPQEMSDREEGDVTPDFYSIKDAASFTAQATDASKLDRFNAAASRLQPVV